MDIHFRAEGMLIWHE